MNVKFKEKTNFVTLPFNGLSVGKTFEWNGIKFVKGIIKFKIKDSSRQIYAGINLDNPITNNIVLLDNHDVTVEKSYTVSLSNILDGNFFKYQNDIYMLSVDETSKKRWSYPISKNGFATEFFSDLEVIEMVIDQ